MVRMLSGSLLIAICFVFGLGIQTVSAQESTCNSCEIKKCEGCKSDCNFEFLGVDFRLDFTKSEKPHSSSATKDVCTSSIPFFSNLPHFNQGFKVVTDDSKKTGNGCQCRPGCSVKASVCCDELDGCGDESNGFCPSPGDIVQLPLIRVAGIMEQVVAAKSQKTTSGNSPPCSEQMFQLQLENVQLKTQMEAMHEKMEMVEKMAQLRAYAATLETRLSMQNKHTTPHSAHIMTPTIYPPVARAHGAFASRTTSPVQPNRTSVKTGPHALYLHPHPHLAHPPVAVAQPPALPRAAEVKFAIPSRKTHYVIPSNRPVLTPKSNQKPKTNSKSGKKISVPDGGTIIIGGNVRKLLPMPKAKIAPLPRKVKSPQKPPVCSVQRTKQKVANLELRIAQLTAELHKLKSHQKHAKPAPDLGAPLMNKFK